MTQCNAGQRVSVPPAWAEQTAKNTGKLQENGEGGAKGGPRDVDFKLSSCNPDADLAMIVARWAELPAATQAKMVALIYASDRVSVRRG